MATMKVRFLDLSVKNAGHRNDLLDAFTRHLDSGEFVLGSSVAAFESAVARYLGRTFAVGTNTGTDALELALRCLNLEAGAEVITTNVSWLASATSIKRAGLQPVFADVSADLNIDPRSVETMISKKTKALLIVHLNGRTVDIAGIRAIAQKHGLKVVEDLAQAFGAKSTEGVMAGSFGDAACLSFNAMKPLSALGDAGAVVFDNEAMQPALRRLRHSGVDERGICIDIAGNCRLDSLQASFLLAKLAVFGEEIRNRARIAAMYRDHLDPRFFEVVAPHENSVETNYTFQVFCAYRDEFSKFMNENQIETKIRYHIPLSDHPVFKDCRAESQNARARIASNICLPLHAHLTDAQIHYVIEKSNEFYARHVVSRSAPSARIG